MINIYRKIRQKLAAEDKVGKYMKYAIGEIVLVVIGILIALQINNWNKERIRRQLKQKKQVLGFRLFNLDHKKDESCIYPKDNVNCLLDSFNIIKITCSS